MTTNTRWRFSMHFVVCWQRGMLSSFFVCFVPLFRSLILTPMSKWSCPWLLWHYDLLVHRSLERAEPCFIMYRLDTKNHSGYEWLFISYSPDNSPVRAASLSVSQWSSARYLWYIVIYPSWNWIGAKASTGWTIWTVCMNQSHNLTLSQSKKNRIFMTSCPNHASNSLFMPTQFIISILVSNTLFVCYLRNLFATFIFHIFLYLKVLLFLFTLFIHYIYLSYFYLFEITNLCI